MSLDLPNQNFDNKISYGQSLPPSIHPSIPPSIHPIIHRNHSPIALVDNNKSTLPALFSRLKYFNYLFKMPLCLINSYRRHRRPLRVKQLTIGTYNILKPESDYFIKKFSKTYHPSIYIGVDVTGKSNWDTRKNIIMQNIFSSNLDLICVQEVVRKFVPEFSHSLKNKGYAFQWIAHSDHPSPWTHGVGIAYKVSKFEEVIANFGTFVHDFFKTKKGSLKPRRHQIVELKDKHSKEITRIASVHLHDCRDVYPSSKRPLQIKQVIDDLEKRFAHRYIIAGDFNQDQYGDMIKGKKNFKSRPSNIEKVLRSHFYATDENYGSTTFRRDKNNLEKIVENKRKIDWIFVKSQSDKLQSINVSSFDFNPQASDHKLVATSVKS